MKGPELNSERQRALVTQRAAKADCRKTGPPLSLDSIPGGPVAEALIRTPDSYLAGLHLRAAMIWIKDLAQTTQ
ncbi:hypothetical protein AQI88_28300 [Streptomyces cellostaticus]|uniref:Uncharacterized protein n=1 Tax=Streptomyces cellostaticus TaxID=67285 RepID=A0A101NHB9_9ACTN|nr:hypothetical protein AQI88_28300 [Streptomyces cellostaticus]GHI06048.1 hypothetical protein Scel_43690 [Streptomyces cellostaticus]